MNKIFINFKFFYVYMPLFILILPLYEKAEPGQENNKIPQPIQEVFQSNLVYPQEKNEIQFTFFPSYRKNRNSEKLGTLMEIEYGISDDFQVIVEWDGLLYHNPDRGSTLSGAGNLELGAQYSWMALGDGNMHCSLGSLLEFPVGSLENGLNEGFLEWKTFFILARDFPQWNQSQLFMEIGFNWLDRIRTPRNNLVLGADSLFWNLGGFFPIDLWRVVLEINGVNNKWDDGGENEIFFYSRFDL